MRGPVSRALAKILPDAPRVWFSKAFGLSSFSSEEFHGRWHDRAKELDVFVISWSMNFTHQNKKAEKIVNFPWANFLLIERGSKSKDWVQLGS